jgi:hypothetical protein
MFRSVINVLHVSLQWFQHHFLCSIEFLPLLFCRRPVDYICVGLFLNCLVDLLILSPIPHCLDYCSFLVSLEIVSILVCSPSMYSSFEFFYFYYYIVQFWNLFILYFYLKLCNFYFLRFHNFSLKHFCECIIFLISNIFMLPWLIFLVHWVWNLYGSLMMSHFLLKPGYVEYYNMRSYLNLF